MIVKFRNFSRQARERRVTWWKRRSLKWKKMGGKRAMKARLIMIKRKVLREEGSLIGNRFPVMPWRPVRWLWSSGAGRLLPPSPPAVAISIPHSPTHPLAREGRKHNRWIPISKILLNSIHNFLWDKNLRKIQLNLFFY